MGITPDITVHERRPKLKSAALAVIATLRMQRLSKGWAQNKKIHEQLKMKLESMRRQNGGARRGMGNGIASGLRIAR
jgi:hypothetical protein